MARLELPSRMNDAQVFPQVLDLELSLRPTVKVELESHCAILASYGAVTGLW